MPKFMCRPDLDDDNLFSPRRWAKLVKAVTQRNSQEGMTELKLIGEPYAYDDEESAEDSSEQSNSESEEPDDGTEQTSSESDKIEEANSESEENET